MQERVAVAPLLCFPSTALTLYLIPNSPSLFLSVCVSLLLCRNPLAFEKVGTRKRATELCAVIEWLIFFLFVTLLWL